MSSVDTWTEHFLVTSSDCPFNMRNWFDRRHVLVFLKAVTAWSRDGTKRGQMNTSRIRANARAASRKGRCRARAYAERCPAAQQGLGVFGDVYCSRPCLVASRKGIFLSVATGYWRTRFVFWSVYVMLLARLHEFGSMDLDDESDEVQAMWATYWVTASFAFYGITCLIRLM